MQKNNLIRGRILAASGNQLVLARGAVLFRSSNGGKSWCRWLVLPIGRLRRMAMRIPLVARLLRLGIHHLVLHEDKALIIANKESFLCVDNDVIQIGPLQGSRPMALCGAEGHFYYGEYRSNPERSPVHIYRLDLNANKWRPVWIFKDVRHVHGVFYDPYAKAFWVTTGDNNEEAAIWRTDDQFRSIRKVIGGSQQFRAVQLLFTPDFVYFGSDTPHEPNHLYRIDRSGSGLEKLALVGESVFYGCKVGKRLFFSTALEPSKINNHSYAEVWQSDDGLNWQKILRFRKDWLPMKYFQYGQVLFPNFYGDKNELLYCTPFAAGAHGKTIFVKLESSQVAN